MLVLGYAALIFFLSAQSTLPLPKEITYHDKFMHSLGYLGFGFLLIRALKGSFPSFSFSKLLWLTVLLCALYGISDELHQSFIPGRDASGYDVLADGIGGYLGVIVWRIRCLLK
ncbi:MAG: VanZ family protein [Candidatus Desulfofervidaceae bacterium]|nr:VanZ family protein [Candidatus Desulfofervidaceae bacterium]